VCVQIGEDGLLAGEEVVAGDDLFAGEEAIFTYLDTHFAEPLEAEQQRAKAAMARRKELEKACLELTTATR